MTLVSKSVRQYPLTVRRCSTHKLEITYHSLNGVRLKIAQTCQKGQPWCKTDGSVFVVIQALNPHSTAILFLNFAGDDAEHRFFHHPRLRLTFIPPASIFPARKVLIDCTYTAPVCRWGYTGAIFFPCQSTSLRASFPRLRLQDSPAKAQSQTV